MTDAVASSPTRLVLVRHGEAIVRVERIVGGPRSCRGLSELGHRQAANLAERWRRSGEVVADGLISSGYPRARETAEPLVDALGRPLEVIPAFGEHDPGPDCDGLPWTVVAERMTDVDWNGNPYLNGFPGGESIAAFHHRIGQAVSHVIASRAGQSDRPIARMPARQALAVAAWRAQTASGPSSR